MILEPDTQDGEKVKNESEGSFHASPIDLEEEDYEHPSRYFEAQQPNVDSLYDAEDELVINSVELHLTNMSSSVI